MCCCDSRLDVFVCVRCRQIPTTVGQYHHSLIQKSECEVTIRGGFRTESITVASRRSLSEGYMEHWAGSIGNRRQSGRPKHALERYPKAFTPSMKILVNGPAVSSKEVECRLGRSEAKWITV